MKHLTIIVFSTLLYLCGCNAGNQSEGSHEATPHEHGAGTHSHGDSEDHSHEDGEDHHHEEQVEFTLSADSLNDSTKAVEHGHDHGDGHDHDHDHEH